MKKPLDQDNPTTCYYYTTGQLNENGRTICGSRRSNWKEDPRPCGVTAVMANGRCRIHGGATPNGVAHPNYIHGKSSRYATPSALKDAYEQALLEQSPLSLYDNIALIDARINQLLQIVEDGQSSDWGKITKLWEDFTTALTERDAPKRNQVIREINDLIEEAKRS